MEVERGDLKALMIAERLMEYEHPVALQMLLEHPDLKKVADGDLSAKEKIEDKIRAQKQAREQEREQARTQTLKKQEQTRTRTRLSTPADQGARQRAAHVAQRVAREIADYPTVQMWHGAALEIKWGSTGTGWRGPWRDVSLRYSHSLRKAGEPPFPWVRLRLAREPLALEVARVDPYAPGRSLVVKGRRTEWPVRDLLRDTEEVARSLLRDSRRLALTYNWSEYEAARFLLTREVPKPAPIRVRKMEGLAPDGRPIEGTASVTVWATGKVSRAAILAALSGDEGRWVDFLKGRPEDLTTVELLNFVERHAVDGEHPSWPRMLELWKKEHGGKAPWRYYGDMLRCWKRAKERRATRSRAPRTSARRSR